MLTFVYQMFVDAKNRELVLDLTAQHPAEQFLIGLYERLNQMEQKNMAPVIEEITGSPPEKGTTREDMIRTIKTIVHDIFFGGEPPRDPIKIRYDSPLKLWPHVRYQPKKEKGTMASKLASKKKTASKKAKKTAAAKSAAKVREEARAARKSKKKTAKKASKKAPAKKLSIDESTKIKVVKDSGEPKMEARKAVKKAVPPAGISAGKLVEKTGCQLRTIEAMIGKGFLEVA